MNDINNYSEYKIKRETMTRIADKLRVVVGKTTPLTPEEIAYYIDRIIFTPQSYASSELNMGLINWESDEIGILPEVHKTQAVYELNMGLINWESDGSGILPEVHKAQAVSNFNLATIFN